MSDRVPILCFHGVTHRAQRSPPDPFGLHVRTDRFAAQLDYLRRGWTVVSLSEYLAGRSAVVLPERAAVITFDDGYRNFLTGAFPLLAERGLPATLFVITDSIDAAGRGVGSYSWAPEDDSTFLSWAEVRWLQGRPGITVGSHTCTHKRLSQIPLADAHSELRRSHSALLQQVGPGPWPLAYPYGMWSDAVAEATEAAGYTCGLTTDDGPNPPGWHAYRLRRTLVGDDDDPSMLDIRMSGVADVARKLVTYLWRSSLS